jgi:S1-C subfamily serine protease
MDSPQHKPMRKRFTFATAIVFAGLIIIPSNGLILPSTAVALQQGINSDTSSQSTSSSSSSSSNPLSLRTMFKQLENSVVQITSKPPNPQSPNTSTSGSGFVYGSFSSFLVWTRFHSFPTVVVVGLVVQLLYNPSKSYLLVKG